MTGCAQIVSELGTPFVLEGLFGDADADAGMMDVELSEDAAATMDVEDEVRDGGGGGGMQIDSEGSSPYGFIHSIPLSSWKLFLIDERDCRSNPRKRAHSPTNDEDVDPSPKRARRLALRTVPLPSAITSAIHSRRTRRKLKLIRERKRDNSTNTTMEVI